MSDLGFIRGASDDEIRENFKLPPFSMEAESSVLGSILLDGSVWDFVSDKLVSDHFYRYEHRLIYEAMAALAKDGKAQDVVSVFEHLQRVGKSDEAGGLPYLNDLAQFVPNASNIARYCDIVRERSVLRKMMSVGRDIAPDGHPKLPHFWPGKLLQAGRPDYDDSVLMAMRAAASLSR